jgi:hypothetical protein
VILELARYLAAAGFLSHGDLAELGQRGLDLSEAVTDSLTREEEQKEDSDDDCT